MDCRLYCVRGTNIWGDNYLPLELMQAEFMSLSIINIIINNNTMINNKTYSSKTNLRSTTDTQSYIISANKNFCDVSKFCFEVKWHN